MKVFVTGVAGFLGSHLADAFLAEGHHVIGNDNLIGGYRDNVPDGVEFHRIDCNNLDALRLLMRDVDVVAHLAATAHEGLSMFSPHENVRHGHCASMAVFAAAVQAGVRRIVFTSSMARYGANQIPFTEDLELDPEDHYGDGKVASERALRRIGKVFGTEWVIAVPHNIYGRRQHYCMSRGTMIKMVRGFVPIENVKTDDETLMGDCASRVVERIHLGTKPARRITLSTGQQVTVGLDHRFRALDVDRIVWREATALRVGDSIASESSADVSFDRASRAFRFGQMLGILISDGSYNDDYQVDFACCIEEDKPQIRKLFTDLDMKYSENNRGVFMVYSREFVLKLRAMGLHATAQNKIIPDAVLAMSHDVLGGVLSGMFSGDGWVVTNPKQNVVGIASISEKLMRQTQRLLLAYGIKTKLSRREGGDRELLGRTITALPIWWLTLLSENVEAFKKIGFVYDRKQAALDEKGPIKESATFPKLGAFLTQIGPFLPASVRLKKPNALNCPRERVTRYSLRQMCDLLDDWLSSPDAEIAPEYTAFVRAKRDVWECLLGAGHLLEIESIEDTEADLYDISLDDDRHNYIGDGLVSHNCDPYRNVAAIMINRMLQGNPPIIYGDGEQRRSFSHVSDCIGPLIQMATAPQVIGEVINIGPDGEFITINTLAEMLRDILRFPDHPIYVPARPQEVQDATCSADKARRLLGYEPKVSLRDGLVDLVAWVRARGPRPFSYDHLTLEIDNDKTPKTWKERLI